MSRFTDQQLATLLAALSLWQMTVRPGEASPGELSEAELAELMGIATNYGEFSALSDEEIDALIYQLNNE